ncbi:MAG: NADH-quinone oxidoreductase subunit C [Hyphomicrobiaceae bacterium]|jgi:NADH-quinone oxidoreductase subunit C
MDSSAIHKLVHSEFGAAIGPVDNEPHQSSIEVDPDRIDAVAAFLKSHDELDFDGLLNLTGVDGPARGKIQVVYEMTSFTFRHDLVLKVDCDREAPRTKTLCGVWRAANWLEREVYDLLGIDFEGHPDLRRILLPDDWVGHPLRKDYVEAPEYHGISTVRESVLNLPGRN